MGWKAYFTIIKTDKEIGDSQLLEGLGFNELHAIDKKSLRAALNPESDQVFIGRYRDNLIICNTALARFMIDDEIDPAEAYLSESFPDSEICSFVLYSPINFWGYSLVKNQEKLRLRAGSSKIGTYFDKGEPLPEEEPLLALSKLNAKGQRIYHYEGFPDEPFEEDQMGEEFVFALTSRYFGENLDGENELLQTIELQGYSFDNSPGEIEIDAGPTYILNRWKPLWLILFMLVLWQILNRLS